MTSQNFQSAFTVPQSPDVVFEAITNPQMWWTGDIEGNLQHVGDQFSYRYGDVHYSKQEVAELVPGQKVVWRVVDSHLAGPEDPSEWTGTDITFEINEKDGQTSGSRIWVLCPSSSASTRVPAPGASTSTGACGA